MHGSFIGEAEIQCRSLVNESGTMKHRPSDRIFTTDIHVHTAAMDVPLFKNPEYRCHTILTA